jgi:hypothetical protein
MPNFERKVLWALDIDTEAAENRLFDHADAAGCNTTGLGASSLPPNRPCAESLSVAR